MDDDLHRFLAVQDFRGTYDRALAELRAGRKTTHWMWFVLPQLEGLGRSATARRYGVRGLDEARAYLENPALGARLRECCRALLGQGDHDIDRVLGEVDAMKLRSSMTLFARAAAQEPLFTDVLARFHDGEPDPATLALLSVSPDG